MDAIFASINLQAIEHSLTIVNQLLFVVLLLRVIRKLDRLEGWCEHIYRELTDLESRVRRIERFYSIGGQLKTGISRTLFFPNGRSVYFFI